MGVFLPYLIIKMLFLFGGIMSIIQFLNSGGMVSINSEFDTNEQKKVDDIARNFGKNLREYALKIQIPASEISILRCPLLFIAKDPHSYHFVFIDAIGSSNTIIYRDLTDNGRIELQSLIYSAKLEAGEVFWAFSINKNLNITEEKIHIKNIAIEYINSILKMKKSNETKIPNESLSFPEIASGLAGFRRDYPIGTKTAFIIMQFGKTDSHNDLVNCIKNTLSKNGIKALRADDKEYMDDLLSNIKTYMHGCDFGIGVFERILEDDFNPNVSLEVGYMMGMGKDVLLLKDKTLKGLHTDLAGKLYKPFDTRKIDESLPEKIEKWLSDKGFI